MYRFFSLALIIAVLIFVFNFSVHLSFPTPAAYPSVSAPRIPFPVSSGNSAPQVSAKYIFILDRPTKTVLYAKSADDHIYPASTTKMMTVLVAKSYYSPDQEISISASFPQGQSIGLIPGEKVTVESLYYALLVQSANDAAEALAANFPGGRSAFIASMNTKALELHLSQTHFLNPTGLDEDGHYSSASDLARLADYLLQDEYLRRIVSVENAVIASVDRSQVYSIANVNKLLGKVSGVLGVKTGFTDKAGEALVTLVSRDGHEVIFSLLGSTDRFTDTEKLIDWTYSNFTWK